MLCENVLFLRFLDIFNKIVLVLRFTIPIILVVRIVLDIFHNVLEVKDSNDLMKIANRFLACVIIFIIPTIVSLFLSLLEPITNMKFNYSECNANIKNIKYYIEREELEEKLNYQRISEESYQKYTEILNNLNAKVKANNSGSSSGGTAIRVGKKYNITDSELTDIAKVCQREQGSAIGAAAEAELMVNKYVLSGYSGTLYDYLFKSNAKNWWHPIKTGAYKSTSLSSGVKEAVRKVIVDGQRTMPDYVNEHDCFDCNSKNRCSDGKKGDICTLTTNGSTLSSMSDVKNRINYKQDQTVIKSVYGATYTFYTFPTSDSDPFGYTADAKQKIDSMNK